MIRIQSLIDINAVATRRAVVTVGTFDGVHLGHREVIRHTIQRAIESRAESFVFTFSGHPLEVLNPGRAPHSLTTPEEKADLIESLGPDGLVMVPFTPAVAAMTADEFAVGILAKLGTSIMVVGDGFRLGAGGRGNALSLADIGKRLGFAVELLPTLTVDGSPVSSTAIRNALASGDLPRANTMLDRLYTLSGPVVAGEGRGRSLGFPTANVNPPFGRLRPADGVYLAEARWADKCRLSLVNVGANPTFGGSSPTIEAHLPGFSGNLYGQIMTLGFVAYLRQEREFSGSEELVEQMQKDLSQARAHAARIYKPDVLW